MKWMVIGICIMNYKRDMDFYGYLEKLNIGIDRMVILKLMIM